MSDTKKQIQQRYKTWFEKQAKNLACTKGQPAKELLSSLDSLTLTDDVLVYRSHAMRVSSIVENQLAKDSNLRWLQSLAKTTGSWKKLFDSIISIEGVTPDEVAYALVSKRMELDEALELIR